MIASRLRIMDCLLAATDLIAPTAAAAAAAEAAANDAAHAEAALGDRCPRSSHLGSVSEEAAAAAADAANGRDASAESR